jgi:hypothetical protein
MGSHSSVLLECSVLPRNQTIPRNTLNIFKHLWTSRVFAFAAGSVQRYACQGSGATTEGQEEGEQSRPARRCRD